ncbi:MAG TPA: family B DNA polymerase [Dongiaceae bacterium]|nr:family B DNA polymerase [Dongiaceae bacterium]
MDLFIRELDDYQRDMNLIGAYIDQNARYLSKMTGQPIERCLEFVKKQTMPGGNLGVTLPMASVLVRAKNGDRHEERMPYTQFLQTTLEKKEILAPTMTTYMPSSVKESVPARYIVGNLAKRSAAKKAMLAAKMADDPVQEAIHNAMQTTYKYKNNALSGAQRSEHTGLCNKTGHSTLTSFCRTITSYGNANNEKFLLGNRHYWCPDLVRANILATISNVEIAEVEKMLGSRLRAPTVEETMKCIKRSTDLYWRDAKELENIEQLVKSLSDAERAAFVFSGDLYHLYQINPEFVLDFFNQLTMRPINPEDDADGWVKRMDDDLKAYVSLLSADILDGRTIKDMKEGVKNKDGSIKIPPDPHGYALIAATARHIVETLAIYKRFIKVFWVNDSMPLSVSHFPASLRRCAITSDTDSTIFTVQYWVKALTALPQFANRGRAVAYTAVYLTSQTIRHILAKMACNLGVEKKNLFKIQMKNEFFFPVFVLTSRAKHYFAYVSAREGNVYKELDMEIKGVGLRNSKVPIYYNKKVIEHMKTILDAAMNGRKISALAILEEIAKEERSIMEAIVSGKYGHLTKETVKTREAYKNPESSNWIHHGMWEQVFAPKYGHAGEMPYKSVKVSLNLNSKSKLQQWLDRIEDPGVKHRMEEWLKARDRTALTMLLMPESVLAQTGVPPEATCGVDIRELIRTTMEAFYLVMESLGFYFKNDRNTKLISDGKYVEHQAA